MIDACWEAIPRKLAGAVIYLLKTPSVSEEMGSAHGKGGEKMDEKWNHRIAIK